LSGVIRWIAFFAAIVFAGAGVYAIWGGVTEGLVKALGSFGVVALGALALYGVAKSGPRN
jgi:hypothetical protein